MANSPPNELNPALHPNYANPFNPPATISFDMREAGRVSLEVYDTRGRRVATLVAAAVQAGVTEVVWDGVNEQGQRVGSGVYVVRLRAESGRTLTQKITLLK